MAGSCKLLGKGQTPGSDSFVLAAVHIDLITFLQTSNKPIIFCSSHLYLCMNEKSYAFKGRALRMGPLGHFRLQATFFYSLGLRCSVTVESESVSHSVVSSCVHLPVTPRTVARRLPCPWNFSGKNTRVVAFPSPGDPPTEGLNLCLLHCRWILYNLSHQKALTTGNRAQCLERKE